MPRVIAEPPKSIRPFIALGVDLEWEDKEQAEAECPFCGKAKKWFCAVATGLWDCKVCGAKGNAITFLRQLWEASDEATKDYDELAATRKLLHPETLMYWGCCKSVITGEWLVPGYDAKGDVCQLYRWVYDFSARRNKLLPTTGLGHGYHRPTAFPKTYDTLYVCEGPWDGMALWEVLRSAKRGEDGTLGPTANEGVSLLADAAVIAVPGSNSFAEAWLPLLAKKRVVLLYDNDHPREVKERAVEGAGIAGMRRVCQLLAKAEEPPSSVEYLRWADGGVDLDLTSGYDVRDLLTEGE